MIRKAIRIVGALVRLLGLGLFVAWVTSPDPKGNPASFEDENLVAGLASPDEAWTLAQLEDETDTTRTLLVLGLREGQIEAVDLSDLATGPSASPFEVLAAIGEERLANLAQSGQRDT